MVSHLIAGSDYIPLSVEIVFNSSISVQCVDIGVVSDTILELDETFFVKLGVSNPNVILQNETTEIRIENDDGKQTSMCIVICYIGIVRGMEEIEEHLIILYSLNLYTTLL